MDDFIFYYYMIQINFLLLHILILNLIFINYVIIIKYGSSSSRLIKVHLFQLIESYKFI